MQIIIGPGLYVGSLISNYSFVGSDKCPQILFQKTGVIATAKIICYQ